MCSVSKLPDNRIYAMRLQESIFGFSVTPVSENEAGDDIVRGDKYKLKRIIQQKNAEKGYLGVEYENLSLKEQLEARSRCLETNPAAYFENIDKRIALQAVARKKFCA